MSYMKEKFIREREDWNRMPTDLSDHAEQAEAFYPGTIPGLGDTLWEMNVEIGKLRRERDAIETILLEWSVKGADKDVAPPWRVGEWVECTKAPRCRAVWHLVDSVAGKDKWEPKLEFEK